MVRLSGKVLLASQTEAHQTHTGEMWTGERKGSDGDIDEAQGKRPWRLIA
jgi:hypothetical protein